MKCRYNRRDALNYYSDNVERYYKERDKAFLELVEAMARDYLDSVDGDKVPTIEEFSEFMDKEFVFRNETDWLEDEYDGEIRDCEERQYEDSREREIM